MRVPSKGVAASASFNAGSGGRDGAPPIGNSRPFVITRLLSITSTRKVRAFSWEIRKTTAPPNPKISNTTTNRVSALVVRRIKGRCSMPVDLLSYTGEAQPSMNPHFRQLGQSELLPRYIFAEGLIARRRVLEVGASAAPRRRSPPSLLPPALPS